MIHHQHAQGTPEWLEARRGSITGSRFKDCRDYKSPTAAEKKEGKTRGAPSSKLLGYAYDTARERCGGAAPAKFQNAAMRTGTEQEGPARRAYEAKTGNLVEEVGFFTTEDGLFGLSPDGLIDDDGVLEIKTMVSSDTLFTAVAHGDVSEYLDQCLGYLWLLGRQWVDLVLWAPDLQHMTIRRITRDENAIEALEADLLEFASLVREQETALRKVLALPDPSQEVAQRQQQEREAAERRTQLAMEATAVHVAVLPPAPAPTPAPTATVHPMPTRAAAAPTSVPSLKLGEINARLAPLSLDAAGLASMGLPHSATDKSAKLWHEHQFASICDAVIAHAARAKLKQLEAA